MKTIAMRDQKIDLVIAGAQKAGTSSLISYLSQHSQVCATVSKEFSYFIDDEEFERGFDSALTRHFTCQNIDNQFLFVKTVDVMDSPRAITRLHQHNPNVHIVLVLRDPVQRAYSAFWYARQMGWEPLDSFDEAVWLAPTRFQGQPLKQRGCSYLDRGIYIKHIRTILDHFPEDKLHVLLTQDLKESPAHVCQEIFSLFKLDPSPIKSISRKHNSAARARSELLARIMSTQNSTRTALKRAIPSRVRDAIRRRVKHFNRVEFSPPPMSPDTRMQLINYYANFNDQLASYLKRDLSQWNRV